MPEKLVDKKFRLEKIKAAKKNNVQFILDEEIDAYIPYNFYEVEKRGKTKKFRKLLFTYDEKKDCYYCPAAFEIPFTRIQKRENEPDLRYYVCKYCFLCVLKNACTDSKNKTITRDPREHFTEFYILGDGGKADNYNTKYLLGQSGKVIVGVVNHEYRPVNYTPEMRLDNKSLPLPENKNI
jgi:hypothetical protein